MKTATITVNYVDENGLPKQTEMTAQYDPDVQSDVITVEFVPEPQEGGPLMRPKTPRL